MDVPRPASVIRRKKLRRTLAVVGVLVLVAAVTVALAQLKPAAPAIDSGSFWPGQVKRGSMIRQVHGPGTLVPEDVRWIPASTSGRVERILTLPGTKVEPDTVILELVDEQVEQEALDAEYQLRAAEADLASLAVQLKNELLQQQAHAADIQAQYQTARITAEANEQLSKEGLQSAVTTRISRVEADELANRLRIEQERLRIRSESIEAQLAAGRARVEQRRALYELRRKQRDALKVRAGIAGVLQSVPVDEGQRVTPGTNLARVAVPGRLKAELRIPETQARDVEIGQKTIVDTRNGKVEGRVARIDPAAQSGTVLVDIAFTEPLPRGARPDQSVDGTIELERLTDVLYVERPAFGQENSTVSLFKLHGPPTAFERAERVQVRFGRSSVNTIEVLDGLQEGDRVILSDMSAWDGYDHLRIR
ncbi:MAG TPA: HlyD family efflux transporter periplasmic adaptor subunit [Vicinamibacterales bacterium]|nr:HlyD family efflux transporter periplasmic adaptor subunit [Vicinamibacterales bacterium]